MVPSNSIRQRFPLSRFDRETMNNIALYAHAMEAMGAESVTLDLQTRQGTRIELQITLAQDGDFDCEAWEITPRCMEGSRC